MINTLRKVVSIFALILLSGCSEASPTIFVLENSYESLGRVNLGVTTYYLSKKQVEGIKQNADLNGKLDFLFLLHLKPVNQATLDDLNFPAEISTIKQEINPVLAKANQTYKALIEEKEKFNNLEIEKQRRVLNAHKGAWSNKERQINQRINELKNENYKMKQSQARNESVGRDSDVERLVQQYKVFFSQYIDKQLNASKSEYIEYKPLGTSGQDLPITLKGNDFALLKFEYDDLNETSSVKKKKHIGYQLFDLHKIDTTKPISIRSGYFQDTPAFEAIMKVSL